MRALVDALLRDAQRFGERMDARLLKQSMYRSSSVLSDRTHEGTSRKRGH